MEPLSKGTVKFFLIMAHIDILLKEGGTK